jgi:O-antigen/teichoic acid export membrane protein
MGHILIGAEFQNKSMYIAIIGAFFNVGLNIYLIPRYSYFGAAAATAITEGLVLISYIYLVRRYVKWFPRFQWIHILTLVATAIMGIVLYFMRDLNINIFFQSIIAVLVFGLTLLPLGINRIKQYYAINIQE